MRNLVLIVALWFAALLPTNSLALGLGEIEVKSFLNQPLLAEIEVISARPGEIDDLLVSLASRDAFSRAGLARPRHLSDLKFEVKKNEAGDEAVIVVTTRAGVKEPFLNFLIEADWSKGRVLREFTVLLDPPFFADQPAPAADPAVETPGEDDASVSEIAEQAGITTAVEPEPIAPEPAADESITEPIALDDSTPGPEPAAEEYLADESQNIIQGDVLVVKGDTLWSIASEYKTDAHSMSQVMLAFLRTNPDAFNDGNINNMKEGAILRAPGAEELNAVGKQEAYAEVLVQNGLWEEYVARVTGVEAAMPAGEEVPGATLAETGETTEEVAEETSGELSLLMPEEATGESAGVSDSAAIEELRNKLAIAEEELEASRIENAELESRIAELQARLSKVEELQKMVEIEDDSLAQIQEQQTEAEAVEPEIVEPEAVESVTEAIQTDEDALIQELLAEEAAAQAEEEAVLAEQQASDDGFVDGEEVTEEALPDTTASDDALTDDTLAPADTGDEITPPAPVIVTEPVREPSIFDGIPVLEDLGGMLPSMPDMGSLGSYTSDPIILAALGGVVILLLALVMLKRRRAAGADESGAVVESDDMFAGDEEEELTPIHLSESDTETEADPESTDIKVPTEEDLSATDMSPAEVAEPAGEEPPAEDDFAATSVIQAADMPEPEAPAAGAAPEQDDVLNEVDVYLAYGLYDNAEELLNSSIDANPERADYRSKLLDTYFATKNIDAFVKEAENLKSMGDASAPYWDRVQVMGYELAPDNALFSDAKDSGLSASDLEIAKPQEADFDLGAADDDDTNFSTTDFNLGEEDTGGDFADTQAFGEVGEAAQTQQIQALGDLDDEDDTNIRAEAEATAAAPDIDTSLDLSDEIGDELEFSMDESAVDDSAAEASGELELPDDLDLGAEEEATPAAGEGADEMDDIAMEFDIGDDAEAGEDDSDIDFGAEFEAALEEADDLDIDESEMIPFEEEPAVEADEDAVELEMPEEDEVPDYEKTAIVDTTPGYEETEVVPSMQSDEDIDLDMEDASLQDQPDSGSGDLAAEADEDDEEDISIIDFGGDDFEEPTDVVESVADEGTDDSIMMAVDVDETDEVKTGTFAPGDFDEPTSAIDSIDDIGDLMLPDDVDEVSTKLDLARAFIDMGDTEGARGSLEEVMSEGNEEQKAEAKALLDQI